MPRQDSETLYYFQPYQTFSIYDFFPFNSPNVTKKILVFLPHILNPPPFFIVWRLLKEVLWDHVMPGNKHRDLSIPFPQPLGNLKYYAFPFPS